MSLARVAPVAASLLLTASLMAAGSVEAQLSSASEAGRRSALAAQQPGRAGGTPTPPSTARRPGALTIEEATTLTQGWGFLAQGDFARAAQKAGEAIARAPRSAAPAALMLEVELARGGPVAGLDAYDRWLGGRTMDEPALVRRIAWAYLQDFAQQSQNPTARFEALRALSDEGDAQARATLSAEASAGGSAETRVLAASGDASAVRTLLAEMSTPRPPGVASLVALGQSRSPLAMAALASKLGELRPEVRGAAAEGLGYLASPDAIKVLKPLLNDQSSHVRMKAAGALYRLNDLSGLAILQAAATSDSVTGRLAAAEAMAVKPDAAWQGLVRGLTQVAEADVRLSAARLIAPVDPALSSSVLQDLTANPNAAIREEAARSLAREGAFDLPSLRLLLRHTDRLTRAYAAKSLVRVTR